MHVKIFLPKRLPDYHSMVDSKVRAVTCCYFTFKQFPCSTALASVYCHFIASWSPPAALNVRYAAPRWFHLGWPNGIWHSARIFSFPPSWVISCAALVLDIFNTRKRKRKRMVSWWCFPHTFLAAIAGSQTYCNLSVSLEVTGAILWFHDRYLHVSTSMYWMTLYTSF